MLTDIHKNKWNISTHSLTRRLTPEEYDSIFAKFISTHSLTRRLTVPATENDFYGYISTHSLTRRLTLQDDLEQDEKEFQLTASQGG